MKIGNFDNLPSVVFGETGTGSRQVFFGEKEMLAKNCLKNGHVIPIHSHPHEEITLVLKGACKITVGDETQFATVGDMVLAPSNVPHGLTAVGDTEIIDVFSPVREDFI